MEGQTRHARATWYNMSRIKDLVRHVCKTYRIGAEMEVVFEGGGGADIESQPRA